MLSDEARQKSETIRSEMERHIARVRGDQSLTEDWKRRQIAGHYLEAKKATDEVLEADQAAQIQRRRSLEQRLFGPGVSAGPMGDLGAALVSRRDAGDRAVVLRSEQEALDLLRRAERSGDEPLARAIAERALDERWADAGNAFVASRPNLSAAYEALWNQHQPSTAQILGEGFATFVTPPMELDGMADYRIRDLVEPA